jgi:hypothetical protein
MSRFFFDIDDGSGVLADTEGSEHSDLRDAQREAIDTLTQMGREIFPTNADRELTIEIRDENGRVLMRTALKMTSVRV